MTALETLRVQESALARRTLALSAAVDRMGTAALEEAEVALRRSLDAYRERLQAHAADVLVMVAETLAEMHGAGAAYEAELFGDPTPAPLPEPAQEAKVTTPDEQEIAPVLAACTSEAQVAEVLGEPARAWPESPLPPEQLTGPGSDPTPERLAHAAKEVAAVAACEPPKNGAKKRRRR